MIQHFKRNRFSEKYPRIWKSEKYNKFIKTYQEFLFLFLSKKRITLFTVHILKNYSKAYLRRQRWFVTLLKINTFKNFF